MSTILCIHLMKMCANKKNRKTFMIYLPHDYQIPTFVADTLSICMQHVVSAWRTVLISVNKDDRLYIHYNPDIHSIKLHLMRDYPTIAICLYFFYFFLGGGG